MPGNEALAVRLRTWSEPLPDAGDPAFADPFERFAGARVVLLGEATHGTSELHRARTAVTRRLVERHGFTVLALEADWPDAAQLDAHVRHHPAPAPAEPPFARFPRWMWRNEEVRAFLRWLRVHNGGVPDARRVEVRGLDIYSLGSSVAAVLRFLDEADPAAAADARRRYGCLSPWQSDPADYGRAVMFGRDSCEEKAVEQLRLLLSARLDNRSGAAFDAVQNARVVRSAEQYYREMFLNGTEAWNGRDRHMFDTLQALLAVRPGAKAVVWAHNSHVGNAPATAMGRNGQVTLGELCRAAFGPEAVLVGFGTDRGTVAAAHEWGGPAEVMDVLPARPDSHEALFRAAGLRRSLTLLGAGECREALSAARLERAIGVVYRPRTERQSHYFEAVLPDQFDAFVWLEHTTAVTPLPGPPGHGGPDLFPFGT